MPFFFPPFVSHETSIIPKRTDLPRFRLVCMSGVCFGGTCRLLRLPHLLLMEEKEMGLCVFGMDFTERVNRWDQVTRRCNRAGISQPWYLPWHLLHRKCYRIVAGIELWKTVQRSKRVTFRFLIQQTSLFCIFMIPCFGTDSVPTWTS